MASEQTLKTLVSGSDTKLRLTRSETATGLASNRNLHLQCAESVVLQSDGPIEAPPQLVNTQRTLASTHIRDTLATPANHIKHRYTDTVWLSLLKYT